MMTKDKLFKGCLAIVGIVCSVCLLIGLFYHMIFNTSEPETKDESVQVAQGWKVAMNARAYISNDELRYVDTYFAGGYPDENVGVCTDVVWSAFDDLGVSIKYLVDKDIAEHPECYASVISEPDPNIDFRRVPVLEIFFERQAESLTTDYNDILAWQAGDIVTFESSHVAIVSGLRNIWGRPYIIQHGKDPAAEEDRLWASDGMEISGHYRWNF